MFPASSHCGMLKPLSGIPAWMRVPARGCGWAAGMPGWPASKCGRARGSSNGGEERDATEDAGLKNRSGIGPRAPVTSAHRSGRRLRAGGSPWRSSPRGGPCPAQPCSKCGASSTRVAANESCTATESMPHQRASHARAVARRSRGGAFSLRNSARFLISQQHVSLTFHLTFHVTFYFHFSSHFSL